MDTAAKPLPNALSRRTADFEAPEALQGLANPFVSFKFTSSVAGAGFGGEYLLV